MVEPDRTSSARDARIEMPAYQPGRWSISQALTVIVSSAGAAALLAWAAAPAGRPALALGLAAPLVVVALAVCWVRAAYGRNGAAVLAIRAGSSRRWVEGTAGAVVPLIVASVVLAGLGVIDALAELPRVVTFVVAVAFAVLVVAVVSAIVRRIVIVAAARRLVQQLRTSRLDRLEPGAGSVELALVVPPDAPTIELPFLAGRWAAVQLYLDEQDRRFSWPERLRVHDDATTAELEVAGIELSGWRIRLDVDVWHDKPKPAHIRALEAATGTTLVTPGGTSLSWVVWAVAPGDTLYVVGDATEIAHGLGAFRGGDRRTIGTNTDVRAAAILGDETSLRDALALELRYQPLVAAFALAWLAALAWVTARIAGAV